MEVINQGRSVKKARVICQDVMEGVKQLNEVLYEIECQETVHESVRSEKYEVEQKYVGAFCKPNEFQNQVRVSNLKKEVEESQTAVQNENETLKKMCMILGKDNTVWMQKYEQVAEKRNKCAIENEMLQADIMRMASKLSTVEKERDDLKTGFQTTLQNCCSVIKQHEVHVKHDADNVTRLEAELRASQEKLKNAELKILSVKKTEFLKAFNVHLLSVDSKIKDLTKGIRLIRNGPVFQTKILKSLLHKLHKYVEEMHLMHSCFLDEVCQQENQVQSGISLSELDDLEVPSFLEIPTVETILAKSGSSRVVESNVVSAMATKTETQDLECESNDDSQSVLQPGSSSNMEAITTDDSKRDKTAVSVISGSFLDSKNRATKQENCTPTLSGKDKLDFSGNVCDNAPVYSEATESHVSLELLKNKFDNAATCDIIDSDKKSRQECAVVSHDKPEELSLPKDLSASDTVPDSEVSDRDVVENEIVKNMNQFPNSAVETNINEQQANIPSKACQASLTVLTPTVQTPAVQPSSEQTNGLMTITSGTDNSQAEAANNMPPPNLEALAAKKPEDVPTFDSLTSANVLQGCDNRSNISHTTNMHMSNRHLPIGFQPCINPPPMPNMPPVSITNISPQVVLPKSRTSQPLPNVVLSPGPYPHYHHSLLRPSLPIMQPILVPNPLQQYPLTCRMPTHNFPPSANMKSAGYCTMFNANYKSFLPSKPLSCPQAMKNIPLPHQMPTSKRERKMVPIIDPNTGKNILDSDNDSVTSNLSSVSTHKGEGTKDPAFERDVISAFIAKVTALAASKTEAQSSKSEDSGQSHLQPESSRITEQPSASCSSGAAASAVCEPIVDENFHMHQNMPSCSTTAYNTPSPSQQLTKNDKEIQLTSGLNKRMFPLKKQEPNMSSPCGTNMCLTRDRSQEEKLNHPKTAVDEPIFCETELSRPSKKIQSKSETQPPKEAINVTTLNVVDSTSGKASGPEHEKFENCCAICLEQLNGLNIWEISCGHTFHFYCITKWLMIQKSCPICRVCI